MHLLIQNPTVFKQFFFFEDYLVSRKLWWLFYFWEEKKCEIHFQNFVEMNFSVLIELVQAILPKSRKIVILFKNPMLLVYEKKLIGFHIMLTRSNTHPFNLHPTFQNLKW